MLICVTKMLSFISEQHLCWHRDRLQHSRDFHPQVLQHGHRAGDRVPVKQLLVSGESWGFKRNAQLSLTNIHTRYPFKSVLCAQRGAKCFILGHLVLISNPARESVCSHGIGNRHGARVTFTKSHTLPQKKMLDFFYSPCTSNCHAESELGHSLQF